MSYTKQTVNINPYENVYAKLKTKEGFSDADWRQAVTEGSLDSYIDSISRATTDTFNTLNKDWNYEYADSKTKLASLYVETHKNELGNTYNDREVPKTKSDGTYEVDADGNIKYETRNMSDYDYFSTVLKSQNNENYKQFLKDEERERKDSIKFFGKLGADIVSSGGEFISGAASQVDNLLNTFSALGEAATGAAFRNENFADTFVKATAGEGGRIFENSGLQESILNFEKRYSTIRDIDGNYTNIGKYLGGVCTTMGQMLPSMVTGRAAGAVGVSNGLASGISSAVFYTGITDQNIREMYNSFAQKRVSVPSGQIMWNSIIKSTLQYGVEVGLAKILGGSALDTLVFGRKAAGSSGGNLAMSGVKRILDDYNREGLEETFQDTSDFLVDKAFELLLNENFGDITTISWQSLADSFVLGGITSFVGAAAKILITKREETADTKTNKKGETVNKKLSKIASWEYGLNLQSFMENANLIIKYNETFANKVSKNIDSDNRAIGDTEGYETNRKQIKKYNDAYTQMYATYRILMSVANNIGEERFKAANDILTRITDMIKKDSFNPSMYATAAKALVNRVKTIPTLTKLGDVEKLISNAKMTQAYQVIDKDDDLDTLDVSAETKENIKAIFENEDEVNRLVLTKDGTNIVKIGDTIFEPLNYFKKTNGALVYATVAEQELVEGIVNAKFTNIKLALDDIVKLYKSTTGDNEATTEKVVYELLFNPSFYKLTLYTGNIDTFNLLKSLKAIEENVVAKNNRTSEYKNKIRIVLDNMRSVMLDYCINNPSITTLPAELGFRPSQENEFKRNKWAKNLYLRIINDGTFKSLSKEDWKAIESRVNSMPVMQSEKDKLLNNLHSEKSNIRNAALNRINTVYNGIFTSKYDGVTYMPYGSVGNNALNLFLQNNNLTLQEVISSKENIAKYQGLFIKSTDNKFTFKITNNKVGVFEVSTNKQIGYGLYNDNANAILSMNKDIGNERTVVIKSSNRNNQVSSLLNASVDKATAAYLSINELILDPSLLNDDINSDIKLQYGDVNETTTFLYLRRYFINKLHDVTIIKLADGTYAFGNIKHMRQMLRLNNNIDLSVSTDIKSLLKEEYLTGRVATLNVVLVKGDIVAQYDGVLNVMYVNKDLALNGPSDYLTFAFLHEIQHCIQADNGMNFGLNANWLNSKSISATKRKTIIADVRKHRPELFNNITKGSKEELAIVNKFVYMSSGESQAYGMEGSDTLDFYPTVITNKNGVTSINLPWGTSYKLTADETMSIITNEDDYVKLFTNNVKASLLAIDSKDKYNEFIKNNSKFDFANNYIEANKDSDSYDYFISFCEGIFNMCTVEEGAKIISNLTPYLDVDTLQELTDSYNCVSIRKENYRLQAPFANIKNNVPYDITELEALYNNVSKLLNITPSKYVNAVFETCKAIDSITKLSIRFRQLDLTKDKGTTGTTAGNLVRLNYDLFTNKGITAFTKMVTIAHECAHAALSYAYYLGKNGYTTYLEFYNKVNELYDIAKVAAKNFGYDANNLYGLTNASEMLAELTNPYFVKKLATFVPNYGAYLGVLFGSDMNTDIFNNILVKNSNSDLSLFYSTNAKQLKNYVDWAKMYSATYIKEKVVDFALEANYKMCLTLNEALKNGSSIFVRNSDKAVYIIDKDHKIYTYNSYTGYFDQYDLSLLPTGDKVKASDLSIPDDFMSASIMKPDEESSENVTEESKENIKEPSEKAIKSIGEKVKKTESDYKAKYGQLSASRRKTFNRKYISKKVAAGTNLEKFGYTRKYGRLRMNEALSEFIIKADERIDSDLWSLVKSGKIVTADIMDYLRTADKIDNKTFKLINECFFKNKFIKDFDTLEELTENTNKYYALRGVLRKMGFSKNVQESTDPTLFIKALSIINSDPIAKKEYDKILANFEGRILVDGKVKDIVINKPNLRRLWMSYFDGSIETGGYIGAIAKIASIKDWNITGEVNTVSGSGTIKDDGRHDVEEGNLLENVADKTSTDAFNYALYSIDREDKVQQVMNAYTPKRAKELFAEGKNYNYILNEFNKKKEDLLEMPDELFAKEFEKYVNGRSEEEINKMFIDTIVAEVNNIDINSVSTEGQKKIEKVTGVIMNKVVRPSSAIVNNIKSITRTIRANLKKATQINKTRERFLKDNSDLFDENLNVKEDIYQTVDAKGKIKLKPENELTEIENRIRSLSKDVRQHVYSTNAALEYKKALEKQIAKLEKENEKLIKQVGKKTVVYKQPVEKIVHEVGDVALELNTDKDIPAALKRILEYNFTDIGKSTTKYLTNDSDYHIQTNFNKFIEDNAQYLAALTQSDIDSIVDFYLTSEILPQTNKARTYNAIQLYLMTYIIKQNKQGRFTLSEEQVTGIENRLEYIISQAGATLANWRKVKDLLKPEETLQASLAKSCGIEFSITDLTNLSDSIASGDVKQIESAKKKMYENALKEYKGRKKSFFDRLLRYERMAMLSSPGTWVRNISSNAIVVSGNFLSEKTFSLFGKLFPKLGKTHEGQYKIFGTKVTSEVKTFIKNEVVDSGLLRVIQDGLSKYDTTRLNKKAAGDSMSEIIARGVINNVFQNSVSDNALVNSTYKFVLKMLSDDAFINKAAIRYLGKILTEDNVKLDEGISTQVIEHLVDAYSLAAEDYMHKTNFFSKMENMLRTYLDDHLPANVANGAMFMYKQVFPFMASSWNWFVEGLNYSPVGLVKGIINFAKLENTITRMDAARQKGEKMISSRFAEYLAKRNIGKGVIGSIGLGIGILLALTGKASIDDEDGEYKLNVGKLKVDISDLFGTQGIMLGITAVCAFKDEQWYKALGTALNAMFYDSVFSDVFNSFRYLDSFGDYLTSLPFTMLSMLIPNFLKTLSTVVNKYKVKYNKGILGKIEKLGVDAIPGLAYAFPHYTDPYTGETQLAYKAWFLTKLVNKLTPLNIYPYNVSELEEEALSVGVSKSALTGTYTIDGNKVICNAKQVEELNQFYGKLNNKSLTALMSNKETYKVQTENGSYKNKKYSQMTDEEKETVINRLMNDNSRISKIYILTKYKGFTYYAKDSEYSELKKLGIKVSRATNNKEGLLN